MHNISLASPRVVVACILYCLFVWVFFFFNNVLFRFFVSLLFTNWQVGWWPGCLVPGRAWKRGFCRWQQVIEHVVWVPHAQRVITMILKHCDETKMWLSQYLFIENGTGPITEALNFHNFTSIGTQDHLDKISYINKKKKS